MCGFVVTTDIDNCGKMMERQQFRGPDAMSMWKDKDIAMAHALLAVSYTHLTLPTSDLV